MLERCASCHRPGQPSPFSLLSYDDVKAKGKEIVASAQARTMPPWLATQGPGFPALKDDPRLTDKQITAIANWVKNGMPSGDLRKAPMPPPYPLTWPLGTPNLTAEVTRVIAVPAGGTGEGRNVVIPIDYPSDPGAPSLSTRRPDSQHAHLFCATRSQGERR